ncbi:MAG TPA: polysaccharide biosynthesis tyrosine autokinase [Terriglobales bacterium]|nr:polysaccharide biosynthesis tyrosine autokinase [Terriglobales bacterium]
MAKLLEPRPLAEPQTLVRFPDPRGEGDAARDAGDFALSYYWFLVWRQRWKIATFVAVMTAMVTLAALAMPKVYDSEVLVRVDPESSHVMGENAQTSGTQMDATMLVSTEQQVITSPAVVAETIQNQGLAQIPEFAGSEAASSTAAQQGVSDKLLRVVTKHIVVDQPIGTTLLGIHFRSRNPQLAAQVANGLANAFVEHEYRTRARALQDSAKYMSDQLDTERAQMEQDQRALVDYESSHDVIDPDDRQNIYNARLSQINADYTRVQAQRMQLQAEDAIAESGDLDALLASPRGQVLQPLYAKLLADQRELNRMGTTYGPRHPLYAQESEIVEHDRDVLREQAQHIAAQVRDEFRTAAAEERLLAAALADEKARVDAFNLRTIKYNSLKAAATSSTNLYYALQQSIQNATVAAGLHAEDLRVISPARPSDRPVSPRPLLDGALAFLLSAMLGVGAAIAAGLMDRTLSSPEQVEMRLGVATVASLPAVSLKDSPGALKVGQYAANLLPAAGEAGAGEAEALRERSAFREAVLSLHTAIQFSSPERIGVLAVTSSVPGEGKSTASAHLAGAFAALGSRTVLVDADMRKPNVHRQFGLSNQIGLSNVLRGQAPLDDALRPVFSNLTVLTSGPVAATPSELLHLGMADVVEQLRGRFDVVLIDCPPVLGFADAASIANLAEGVLLIVQAGRTEQQQVGAALRQLRGVRANILGIVLNRVSEHTDSYYRYYRAADYGYYSDDEDAED